MTIDVSVNLLWCVPGDVGGSEEYLVRQLLGLAAEDNEFRATVHAPPSLASAHPDLAAVMPFDSPGSESQRRARRVITEHTWLARRTRSAALVHHGGGTTPLVGKQPIVLTIHDLQYLTHPGYHSAGKLRYLRALIPRSIRRAAVVATPTEWVKSTVVDAFGVDAANVVVVPHGVEPALGADAPGGAALRKKYDLGSGQVLVFPAITHPHKGHAFLLDVMARHWHDPDLRLVLLGGQGLAEGVVTAKIAELGLGDRVVRPGRVPAADRDGLVGLADALVFPSEYEGFGAPVVEAMALGTPVIAARQPAVAEVLGGAGVLLERDDEAWADALDVLARRRDELVAAGRQRAVEFTSARSGAALAAAYRQALR